VALLTTFTIDLVANARSSLLRVASAATVAARSGGLRPSATQLLYSNRSNRRQAEQVEAALQQWDLQQNQPPNKQQRFSLHQRWSKNFSAKACEGHVLLVEVTKELFAAHEKAVFVLKASGQHVGPDGKVVN
jgi:hypothetical protein